MEISAAEAAQRLGVNAARVRQLLAVGRLAGRRVGRAWLIPEEEVARLREQRRLPGRPLGPRRAWGLLDLLAGGNAAWLSASARSQLHASLDKYVNADPDRWRAALGARNQVVPCQVHPAALERLLRTEGILPTGVGLAAQRGFDLIVSDKSIDRVYADPVRWPKIARALAIRSTPDLVAPVANLVVLLPNIGWPFTERVELPDSVLAADLLDEAEPRAVRAGAARLNELLTGV